MYLIIIKQCLNGWIVEVNFLGRTEINHVFNKKEELINFLNENLFLLNKGYNTMLKQWTKDF